MAIAHDISECIVGDITPHCGVGEDEKHRREQNAVDKLSLLINERGTHFKSIYAVCSVDFQMFFFFFFSLDIWVTFL